MARKPEPYADPVQVGPRTYPSGKTVYRVRFYPTGIITNPNDRRSLDPFSTRAEAEEEAELLRAELASLVEDTHPGVRPSARSFQFVLRDYVAEIGGDTSIPRGTRLSYLSAARIYLGYRAERTRRRSDGELWGEHVVQADAGLCAELVGRTIGELPRFADRIMASVESGSRAQKSENTKSGARTSLAHFGAWLVANDFLEENCFAPDADAAAERQGARRRARREAALARAKSPSADSDDGDADKGIGIKDVPSLAVVSALRRAVVRRATGAHDLRKKTGRGSSGGPSPLGLDAANQIALSIMLRACTGLRTCEVLALHTSRITEDGFEITIDRQLDRYTKWTPETSGQQLLVPPKYDRPRRAVVWPQFVPQLLELGEVADAQHDGWLFPRTRAQGWWVDAYEHLVIDAIKLMNVEHAAGTIDPLTNEPVPAWTWAPHFLRHVYGSYSISPVEHGGLGWPLGLVSEAMGHGSSRTTEAIYLHPTRSERQSIRSSGATIQGL